MFTGKYQTLEASTNELREIGYISAWAAPISSFTAIKRPTLSIVSVCGDAYIITDDHEWLTGREPIELFAKKDTIEINGESVGVIGGARQIFRTKLFIKGDGSGAEEILTNLLNEPFILFVRDLDFKGGFIQLGSESLPGEIEKKSGKSGSLISGGKGTELTVRCFDRFFYHGIIPLISAVFGAILTDDGVSLQTDDGKTLEF